MENKSIFDYLIDFLFPPVCISCGEIIDSNEKLCKECKDKLQYIPHNKRCLICGGVKPDCDCKRRIFYFKNCVSVFFNENAAKNIIYRYKLSNRRHYAGYIADKMIEAFREEYSEIQFDYITYVPSSFKSKMKRGFDQSEILAKIISRKTGIPLKRKIIGCKPFKPAQHKRNYKERFQKIRNQYFVKNKQSAGNVLLIDDIKTTGATLNICSKVLLLSGADTVYCLTALGNKMKKQPQTSI